MKLVLTFLAFLAVSGLATVHGIPVGSKNDLVKHIEEFLMLLPQDKMEDLFFDYLADDEDFAETVDYLQGDEFKLQLMKIEAATEFKAYLNYLEESGLPAYESMNKVNDFLGIDPIAPFLRVKFTSLTGGLPGFLKDLKALFPTDEISKLYSEKIANVPEFAELIKHLQSKEAYDLFEKLMSNPTVDELLKVFEAKGIDVNEILDFVGSIINFQFPERPASFMAARMSVIEHLKEFLTHIPKEQFEELFYEYLADDQEFATVIDYVQSDEFKIKIQSIESVDEFKAHLYFFEKFGIPAHDFVNKVNELLGTDPISSFRFMSSRITGGLRGFFQDLKELLPILTLQKIYAEKMESSDEFATFMKTLLSHEYYSLVKKLTENKDVKDIIDFVESKNVGFNEILDFIESLFGVHLPRPELLSSDNLVKELKDFKKLMPTEAMEYLFFNYLADDEDFAAALDYIQGDEFKEHLISTESTSEFKDYLNFLENIGLPAYEYVNMVNSFLGIDLVKPLHHLMSSSITGGFAGFIKDIKALLPTEEIKKLHDEKLKSSPVFAQFVEHLQSKESFDLFYKLYNNPNIQKLRTRVESKGVSIQEILKFVSAIFGYEFPPLP